MVTFLRLISRLETPLRGISNVLPRCCSYVTSTRELVRVRGVSGRGTALRGRGLRGVYSKFRFLDTRGVGFSCSSSGMLGKYDFGVSHYDVATVLNSDNTKGDAVFGLLLDLCSLRSNDVALGNDVPISPSMEKVFSCIPRKGVVISNAVERGVTVTFPGTGRRMVRGTTTTTRVLSCVRDLPRNFSAILSRENTNLSRNRLREVTVTETLIDSTPVLLLSRTASTLSGPARTGILHGVGTLRSGAMVLIARHASGLGLYSGVVGLAG